MSQAYDELTRAAKQLDDFYREKDLLKTETPLLEDDGNGVPSQQPWRFKEKGSDGRVASQFFLAEIDVAEGDYPTISLTPLGWNVMQDKEAITLELPQQTAQRDKKKSRAQEPELVDGPEPDLVLLNALREWRRAKAVENGMPAYRVYTNRTLEALAASKPVKHVELLNITGIGPAKARQYGSETLKIISKFVDHE